MSAVIIWLLIIVIGILFLYIGETKSNEGLSFFGLILLFLCFFYALIIILVFNTQNTLNKQEKQSEPKTAEIWQNK